MTSIHDKHQFMYTYIIVIRHKAYGAHVRIANNIVSVINYYDRVNDIKHCGTHFHNTQLGDSIQFIMHVLRVMIVIVDVVGLDANRRPTDACPPVLSCTRRRWSGWFCAAKGLDKRWEYKTPMLRAPETSVESPNCCSWIYIDVTVFNY
jgi:hypothetical protein